MMATPTTKIHDYAVPLRDDVRDFLMDLLRRSFAHTYLEIGTGEGVSTTYIARHIPHLKIDTVEKRASHVERAYQSFFAHDVLDRVHIYHDDAFEFYPTKPYDAILIDAAKSHQQALVEKYIPHVSQGGFMLVDNTDLSRVKTSPVTRSRDALSSKHDQFIDWLITTYKDAVTWHDLGDGIALIRP